MLTRLSSALNGIEAVLFDLDGVLTPTVELHMDAWRTVFSRVFEEHKVAPYVDEDYHLYADGKARMDGVRSYLDSRSIAHTEDYVAHLGKTKEAVFQRLLSEHGISPYPGSLRFMKACASDGLKMAVVSSSRSARKILKIAGIRNFVSIVVDGTDREPMRLRGKPYPDMFLAAADFLNVSVDGAAVVEDALSGVQAGVAGAFGLVVGVDRGVGREALLSCGADVVVSDLDEFLLRR